jgi:hypothetical protein
MRLAICPGMFLQMKVTIRPEVPRFDVPAAQFNANQFDVPVQARRRQT